MSRVSEHTPWSSNQFMTSIRPWVGLALLAFLALLPVWYLSAGDGLPFVTSIFIEIFVFAVFAMSFNLLMGYTGYVSFGHTLFLGSGAYATGLLTAKYGVPMEAVIPLAVVLTAVLALGVGAVAFRRSGVYFAMISLGVAQVVYTTFRRWDYVGGTTGLTLDYPTLFGYQFDPFNPVGYYYLTLASVVAVYVFLRFLVRSPFGHVLRAIRENEERAEAIGYHTRTFKLVTFTISGALAGYAGVLYAMFFTQVAPGSTLYWGTTGDGLFMVLIGGLGTLVGPIIGAFFVVGFEYILSTHLGGWIPAAAPELVHRLPERWPLLLGLVFMATVLYFPKGIAGGLGISQNRSVSEVLKSEDPTDDAQFSDDPAPEYRNGGDD